MMTAGLCKRPSQLPRSQWAASGHVRPMQMLGLAQTRARRRRGRVPVASTARHGLPALLTAAVWAWICQWCSVRQRQSRQAARRGRRAARHAALPAVVPRLQGDAPSSS